MANSGRIWTEEQKLKLRGRKLSNETRIKMSLAKTGIKFSKERKQKISNSHKGKPGHRLGTGIYGKYGKSIELVHFKGCHYRVKIGKSPTIDYSANLEGLLLWMAEIGPRPQTKDKWSVGRKEHHKGYVKGNIFWQLFSENVSEMRKRITKK